METEEAINDVFRVGMIWRIVYGFFRTALGLSLLRYVGEPISHLVRAVMGSELIEDPSDGLFQLVDAVLQHHQYAVTYFLAAYLIFWGLTDIFLSIGMLRRKLWSFPISLLFIFVFTLYEVYRFSHTHSLILLSVIVVDTCLLVIIQYEYKKAKARSAKVIIKK